MNRTSPTPMQTRIECAAPPSFQAWLAQSGGSLAVSTYQAGKVAMIGWDGRQITLMMREFEKPMGMATSGDRLVLATRNDIWMMANAPLLAHDYIQEQPGRYDALYLPRATYHTGDLNTHDLAFDDDGLLLVASRFSCLARLTYDHSFTPIWKPRFVTDLVPEDRCHLNGLAVRDGKARYVTALGTTDAAGMWREEKATGGVLIDIEADEILLGGMAMPHSPRWHNEQLWVLNSGAGQLLQVDPSSGQSNVVCELSAYLRGLCFVDHYALIGMCKIREKHIFGGLPVQQRYEKLLCGVAVVDTRSGEQVGMFEYTSGCEEVFEIRFLPGVYRPMILNLERRAAREAITNCDSSFWLRPGNERSNTPNADSTSERATGRTTLPPSSSDATVGPMQQMGNMLPDSGN